VKRTLLLPLLLAVACGNAELVIANRLAPGGGGAGDGGTGLYAQPQLDIAVRIEHDATDFNAGDLLRLMVNGVDRTDEVVIGGNYAILRLDPSPVGSAQFVELFRRTGPVLDSFTYEPMAFAGAVLDSIAPESAAVGATVTIAGTGFDAGVPRVFFGGVEGAVTASDATSIQAMVPAGARSGIVYALIGADAADGVAAFQLLDGAGAPVALPGGDTPILIATLPARGGVETVVRSYGAHLDDDTLPNYIGRFGGRLVDIQDVASPLVDGLQSAFAVVDPFTKTGAADVYLRRFGENSNRLPFTVE
jgi:hypothetical protein